MSSNEPANEMYSVDRSHNQSGSAEQPPPATQSAPAPEPAPPTPQDPTSQMVDVPLGTLIFRAGLLGEEQLEDALQEGMRTGKRLGEVLLEWGWLNERDLGRMLAGQKGLPFIEVSAADTEPDALQTFVEEKARRQAALPLRYEDGLLVIAVGDPSNELVLESLRRDFGSGFRLVVAPHGQLQDAIGEAYALLASQPEPAPAADTATSAQPEPAVDAHPEPDPEPEPELAQPAPLAQPDAPLDPQPEQPEALLEFSPADDDGPEPLPEQAPEPEASGDDEPESRNQPFAGSTPTLLSRMLFPSVRHATHEGAESAPAQESPEPQDDLAQFEVAEVPELSISTAAQEAPEPEAAPVQEQSAEEPEPEAAPVPEQSPEEPEPDPAPSPEQSAEEPEAEGAPAPEQSAEEPEPQPADETPASTHRVLVRLRDGEPLELGRFQTAAEASARAQEAIGEIASAESEATWPLLAGRYLRPGTIVSVDLLEESPDA
jgi:MshEN domain